MTAIFQVLDQTHTRFGKEIVTSGSTIQPGLLVKLNSDGDKILLCEETQKATGFAFGTRDAVYTPLTKVFADGEEATVVMGAGLALISADFFTSGSLPSADADLYAGASGKITTVAGSNIKFGHSLATKATWLPQSGVGVSQDLSLIRFNFDSFA
jgi:hypothetical protein